MSTLAGGRVAVLAGTLGRGGAERQLNYLVRALRALQVEAHVLTLGHDEFWEGRLRAAGTPVTRVGQGRRGRRAFAVVHAARRAGVQLVHAQHFYVNLYACLAARALGVGELGAIRNDVASEVAACGRWLGPPSLRLPRVLVANSERALAAAAARGVSPRRLRLLPNVVDTASFRPAPHREPGPVRLLAVGRLEPQKRFDRFLALLAALREEFGPRVHGTLAGEGSCRPALEHAAARLGLDATAVTFLGAVDDAASLYRAGDLLVLTSDHEGMPNVVLEAMACGLPVVATDVGGVGELVEPGRSGELASPGDDRGLYEALRRLVQDPMRREAFGTRGREIVEARRAVTRLPAFVAELYEGVWR